MLNYRKYVIDNMTKGIVLNCFTAKLIYKGKTVVPTGRLSIPLSRVALVPNKQARASSKMDLVKCRPCYTSVVATSPMWSLIIKP